MAPCLNTVGHGTASQAEFARLLNDAGVTRLVDARRYPGSRAHPHAGREALARWLPTVGVSYRWEERLGGRRSLPAESPDQWWRVEAFRAYAHHMRSDDFLEAINGLLAELGQAMTVITCSKSLWWRCHRRLIADFTTLARDVAVLHLSHDGRLAEHPVAADTPIKLSTVGNVATRCCPDTHPAAVLATTDAEGGTFTRARGVAMTTNTRSRVIVGVDESLAGLRALRCAVAEARQRRAILTAVRIWSVRVIWPSSPIEYLGHQEMEQQAIQAVHQAFTSAMVEIPLDVEVRIATRAGTPGPELVRLADRDSDLLVVGSDQRTWLARMLRRSTAAYCVAHANCPVLVVPRHSLAKAGTARAMSRQLRREAQRLVDCATD